MHFTITKISGMCLRPKDYSPVKSSPDNLTKPTARSFSLSMKSLFRPYPREMEEVLDIRDVPQHCSGQIHSQIHLGGHWILADRY